MHKVNFITWSIDVRSDERVIASAVATTGWMVGWLVDEMGRREKLIAFFVSHCSTFTSTLNQQ